MNIMPDNAHELSDFELVDLLGLSKLSDMELADLLKLETSTVIPRFRKLLLHEAIVRRNAKSNQYRDVYLSAKHEKEGF